MILAFSFYHSIYCMFWKCAEKFINERLLPAFAVYKELYKELPEN